MKKKFLFALFALMASVSSVLMHTAPTSSVAICTSSTNPLAITRWCENIDEDDLNWHDDCQGGDCKKIKGFVTKLATNIGKMIADVGAYIAVVLVMFGGFLYMTSAGDPGKAAKGQKTIVNATIGIVITKISKLVLRAVSDIATRVVNGKNINTIASEVAGEFMFWGGAICVIMIMWGGFQYATSAGDPGKAAKAKTTILYSVIGLVLMIVASIIVNFAVNTFK